jgi:hypothetical protein
MKAGNWVPQCILLFGLTMQIFDTEESVLKTPSDVVGVVFGMFLLWWGGFFDGLITYLLTKL